MLAKKYLLLLITIPIFLLSLIATTIPVQAAISTPYVKVYTSQAVYPFKPPGLPGTGSIHMIDFIIETHGFYSDWTPSIIGWGMLVQVDPSVILPIQVRGAMTGYFLFDWYLMSWEFPPPPTFVSSIDPTTGEVSASETFMPPPLHGAGDEYSGLKLFTIVVRTQSDTQPCLINIVKGDYQTENGVWHNFEIANDAQYGEPSATYISNTNPTIDLTSPIGSTWHELWPNYCNMMTLHSWEDNDDEVLSPSDQIDMVNETDGYLYWWHVDAVTVTIHWTFKDGTFIGEPGEAEPTYTRDNLDYSENPIGTTWYQIYPEFNRTFEITSWDDNSGAPDTPGNGVFDPSDQFDFVYEDDGATYNAHLDDVTIDLILSFKYKEVFPEFPLGIGLMLAIAPAIPIVYLWRTRKKVTAK
jgi:hypothetical protein